MITSGTELLDTLIDGVHTGDNLVFMGGDAAPLELMVQRFITASEARGPVVLVSMAGPWSGPVPPGARVVDLSASAVATAEPFGGASAVDASLDDALRALEAVDREVGCGATFVFEPLSTLPDAWGADAALELFLAMCPRLYRRLSLAVWPVRRDEHRPSFLRRLEEVTQVVVEVEADDGAIRLAVRKADGRRAGTVGRGARAELVGGDLRATEAPVDARQRLGGVIREQRLVRGLSQIEVARRVGISPSALSQVERGVRGPSGDTLVRLWEVLEVPFGPDATSDRGYRVSRRSGRERVRLQEGLHGERLLETGRQGGTWYLEVAPAASGDRAPFAVKAAETVVVTRGVLDLQLGHRIETVHEGDAIEVISDAITGWANPGPRPAELIWRIHGSG